jgi:outer membrane protein TolC
MPESSPFAGGVPTGERTADALDLHLADAIARGLQHNLGVIAREEAVEGARGERWRALSAVLPNVSGEISADREVLNLAALGFAGFPGIPSVIGPFNVFDARISLSQPIVDAEGLFKLRESNQLLDAAQHSYRNARDLVVLAVTNLYLRALAADSRVNAVSAQLETADALARLADDRKRAGLVPAIDLVRAELQRQTERQRLVVAENVAAKQKLALARAIGLPLGQALRLSDAMPFTPATLPALDDAVKNAYQHREDFQSRQAQVTAARSAARSAAAAHLPSMAVDANWGSIGQTVGSAIPTYTIAANVRVPLFNAADKARAIEAGATLRRTEAELEDARGRIYYEVQSALLDADAARRQVDLAARGVELADQQLEQARDRFGAGVADTIEVVQAQEAVANAHDARVASLYGYNAARAALAGALGLAEEQMPQFLGANK